MPGRLPERIVIASAPLVIALPSTHALSTA
jgi:hypothetical protein